MEPLPIHGSRRSFGIWGSATGDIWFVGNGGVAFHWNGVALMSGNTNTPQALVRWCRVPYR